MRPKKKRSLVALCCLLLEVQAEQEAGSQQRRVGTGEQQQQPKLSTQKAELQKQQDSQLLGSRRRSRWTVGEHGQPRDKDDKHRESGPRLEKASLKREIIGPGYWKTPRSCQDLRVSDSVGSGAGIRAAVKAGNQQGW